MKNKNIFLVMRMQILLAIVLLIITGCGSGSGSGNENGNGNGTPDPAPLAVGKHSSYEFKQSAPWVSYDYGQIAIGYADWNQDGKYDYVHGTVSGTTNTAPIQMLMGDGFGRFGADTTLLPVPVPGVVHARKITVGDYNGDGVADFFIADHGFDQFPFPGASPVLMLSSGGKYIQQSIPNVPVGFHHSASSADVTNSGKIDIVVMDTTNGAFYLSNDGKGNFTFTRAPLPLDGSGNSLIWAGYYTTEFIDVDGDGFMDMLVGGHEFQGAVTRVYWGNGTRAFTTANSTALPADPDYGIVLDFVAEDTDGDGIKELIVNRTKSNPFYQGFYIQILSQSNRVFTDVSTRIAPVKSSWPGATAQWVTWIQLVDTNGDKCLDIRNMNKAANLVFLNNCMGVFSRQ